MQSKYSIKDLEHFSGIKAHTIRAWESRYNIIEPYRSATNIRYYVDDHLKKILNIAALVKKGGRISKLAQLSDEEIRMAVMHSGRYESNFVTYINSLKTAMLAYDEQAFDAVISRCIVTYGAEQTLREVIGPFIKEMGFLWQISAINVSHEHFSSNLIRMKLLALIEQNVSLQRSSDKEAYILYLPSDELHELSLLYLYYHLVINGSRVVYLGQAVPMEYLKEVSQKTGIKNFISVFTTNPHEDEVLGYLTRIEETFYGLGCYFLFCGKQLELVDDHFPNAMITIFKGFQDLCDSLKV